MPSPANPNKELVVSQNEIGKISVAEGFSSYPYDDIANHCTVGHGILLSLKPCTAKQKITQYDISKLQANFHARLVEAQVYIKHYVNKQALNQNQFDALTSFVFNVGVGHAQQTLLFVNVGLLDGATEEMKKFVYVTKKHKNGKPYHVVSNGLVNRRTREISLFNRIEK